MGRYEDNKIVITSEAGNPAEVNENGQLHTVMTSFVDDGNSSTTVLDPGGINVFTGDSMDVLDYAVVGVATYSDVASATDGLQVQFSTDNTNWDHCDEYSIVAATGKTFSFQPAAKYMRVIYINGDTIQTEFRLQTTLHKTYIKPSSHRIADSISGQDDAELQKAVITGLDAATAENGGKFVNAKVTSSGILLVSDYLIEVAKNNIAGENIMNKFGENPSITAAGAPEDVWDGGGIYAFYPTVAQAMEIVSTDANDSGLLVSSGTATGGSLTTLIDTGADFTGDGVAPLDVLINDTTGEFSIIESVDSGIQLTLTGMSNGAQEEQFNTANSAGDLYRIANANDTGAAVVQITGLDANWHTNTETVILNGLTEVNLANTWIRVNRMFVVSAGTADGAEGAISCQIQGGGTIAAQIVNGNNQTLMAIYTVPAGRTGRFLQGYVGLGKGTGATTVGANFTWRSRSFGGVFAIKGSMQLTSSGAGHWTYNYAGAPGIPAKSDIIIRCEEVSATVGVVGGMDILLLDN